MRPEGEYIKGKSVEPIIHIENPLVFCSHFLKPLQKPFLISLESRLELIHCSATHGWANRTAQNGMSNLIPAHQRGSGRGYVAVKTFCGILGGLKTLSYKAPLLGFALIEWISSIALTELKQR
jgi:hypothetical protein